MIGGTAAGVERSATFPELKTLARRPKHKNAFLKFFKERKRLVEKGKYALCLEQRKEMQRDYADYLKEVIQERYFVQRSKHVMPAFSECFMHKYGRQKPHHKVDITEVYSMR